MIPPKDKVHSRITSEAGPLGPNGESQLGTQLAPVLLHNEFHVANRMISECSGRLNILTSCIRMGDPLRKFLCQTIRPDFLPKSLAKAGKIQAFFDPGTITKDPGFMSIPGVKLQS